MIRMPWFCLVFKINILIVIRFNDVFAEASFKTYNFRMRAKADTYNDETRVKHTIVDATELDFGKINK